MTTAATRNWRRVNDDSARAWDPNNAVARHFAAAAERKQLADLRRDEATLRARGTACAVAAADELARRIAAHAECRWCGDEAARSNDLGLCAQCVAEVSP